MGGSIIHERIPVKWLTFILAFTSRGKAVPSGVSGPNRKYTVKQLATRKGEEEALLQEIVSWVALKHLNAV